MGGCVVFPGLVGAARRTLVHTVGVSAATKGYASGAGAFGALAPSTILDASGVSRFITHLWWRSSDSRLQWGLLNPIAPNTDATFRALVVNGTRFTRASGAYVVTADAIWSWITGDPIGGGASVPIIVEL